MPTFLTTLSRFVPHPDSDRALVERFAETNDQAAFAAIVDRHGPLVLGVCRRTLRDDHLADDAFQATFLALARKAATLRDPGAVSSWLFGVARRIALAGRRQRQQTVNASSIPAPAEARGDWADLLRVLDEELARLPDRFRAPLITCYLRGLTQDEAARALGWSLSTLRRRLDRGRELLRSRLVTRGATLGGGLAAGAIVQDATAVVPAALYDQTIESAAGGPVPAGVMSLLSAARPGRLVPVLAIGAVAVVGLAGAAWVVVLALSPSNSSPVPIATAPPIADDAPRIERMANPWVEPLPPGAIVRLGTTAFRHGTDGPAGIVDPIGVWQLAFHPDGSLVSVGGQRVRSWDPATGKELDGAVISTRLRWLIRARIFGGGRFLALPDADEVGNTRPSVTIWDLGTRRAVRTVTFATHPGRKSTFIAPTAVNANGTRFAEVDGNGDVWVWDENGAVLAKLAERLEMGAPAFLTPDGKSVVTVDGPHRVRVWDTTTGTEKRKFQPERVEETNPVVVATMSPDGRWLATLGKEAIEDPGRTGWTPEGFVRLWDLTAGRVHRELSWPWGDSRLWERARLAFSADSSALVGVGLADSTVLRFARWSVPDGTGRKWQAPVRGASPFAITIDPKRNLVATSGWGSVRLFDAAAGRELVPADGPVAEVLEIDFGLTEMRARCHDGMAWRWDPEAGRLLGVETDTAPIVADVTVHEDHLWIGLAGPAPRQVWIDVFAALGGRPGWPGAAAGRKWPAGTPDLIPKWSTVSPDGTAIAVGVAVVPPSVTELGRVGVIDLATGKLRWQVPTAESAPATVRFSPDGSLLAVGTTRVRVFDAKTGEPVAVFDGHRGAVTALAFDPAGRRLASGSTDTTTIVWRLDRR
ncbi:MAG TPA: sigma-70 family RNA polymerase sigma factor [Gemmataceae bacterium]|nr:sigma-70 family RNA polymerase sigma factor [Gemmataceae bacterium]